MSPDELMSRPMRLLMGTIAAMASALVLFGVFAFLVRGSQQSEVDALRQQVTEQRDQIGVLSAQVGLNQRANECRARATNLLDDAQTQRDAAAWQALIDRFFAAAPLEDRPQLIRDLNRQTLDTAALKRRAVAECSKNPDFIPPS